MEISSLLGRALRIKTCGRERKDREEAGLGRERCAAMQAKSGPEMTPQGTLEPGWPFRVVLSCEEETLLDAGYPRKGCDIGWNSCEGCQLTSFSEIAGEINPTVLRGGSVAHSTHTTRNDVRFWNLINLVML